mmetsp:Transcript_142614/g.397374  ORF Transcript_142614/g.397374 Transcript_142614/m.397374 type:complete len:219 (+) Transcript_142614:283-939(+)
MWRTAAAMLGGTIARQQVLLSRSSVPGGPRLSARAGGSARAARAPPPKAVPIRESAPGAARKDCWPAARRPSGDVRASAGASIHAGPMPKKPRMAPDPSPKARYLISSLVEFDEDSAASTGLGAATGSGAGMGSTPASGSSSSSSFCNGFTQDSRHCKKSAMATQKMPVVFRRGFGATRADSTAEESAASVPDAASTPQALRSTSSCRAAASAPGSSA